MRIPDDPASRLTKSDLPRLLGFETGDQIDEFLKEHEAFEDYTLEDLCPSQINTHLSQIR